MRFAWWIDEPLLRGCSNPTDGDLARFRAEGMSVAVSLLDESKQPQRYDKQSALDAGWTIHSIPIEEGHAPSLEQIRDFTNLLEALPPGRKVLVFCESGLGRTAFMGAVYWIMKGLSASQATARVNNASSATEWLTPERQKVLALYRELQWGADKKE